MMDGNTTKNKGNSSRSWCWTDERHLRFLNSIEASFVRSLFENNGRSLRLDRHIPDSSESTEDLAKERRRRYPTSDAEEPSIRADKKNKRLPSNDQVVPQLEISGDNKDDNDRVHVRP